MCCEERSEKAPGRRWHFGWAVKVERREKHKFEGSKQTRVAGGQALGLGHRRKWWGRLCRPGRSRNFLLARLCTNPAVS